MKFVMCVGLDEWRKHFNIVVFFIWTWQQGEGLIGEKNLYEMGEKRAYEVFINLYRHQLCTIKSRFSRLKFTYLRIASYETSRMTCLLFEEYFRRKKKFPQSIKTIIWVENLLTPPLLIHLLLYFQNILVTSLRGRDYTFKNKVWKQHSRKWETKILFWTRRVAACTQAVVILRSTLKSRIERKCCLISTSCLRSTSSIAVELN